MIRHLRHGEINRQKWDECIRDSFNGIVYAYSWYLDVVTDKAWEAFVEDDYKRVFPFFPKRKWGIKYVFQPFACQQLGVFSLGKLDASKVDEFLLALMADNKLINVYLNVNNRVSLANIVVRERLTYQMDMIAPYNIMKERYRTNHKRNIRKAMKEKLRVKKSIKPSLIIKMFKENKGRKLQSKIDYDLYQRLFNAAMQHRVCFTYGVVNEEEKLLGGVVFLYSHNRVIYSFAAVNEEGKRKRAMFLLVDSFIRENHGRNIVLDFEGSNNQKVAFFYSGFGAVRSVYLNFRYNDYPFPLGWITNKYMGD